MSKIRTVAHIVEALEIPRGTIYSWKSGKGKHFKYKNRLAWMLSAMSEKELADAINKGQSMKLQDDPSAESFAINTNKEGNVMKNRGTSTVMNIQVRDDEMNGFDRLTSAGIREGAIYVDLNMYIDREESHQTVDEALEKFRDVNVFCFFV